MQHSWTAHYFERFQILRVSVLRSIYFFGILYTLETFLRYQITNWLLCFWFGLFVHCHRSSREIIGYDMFFLQPTLHRFSAKKTLKTMPFHER